MQKLPKRLLLLLNRTAALPVKSLPGGETNKEKKMKSRPAHRIYGNVVLDILTVLATESKVATFAQLDSASIVSGYLARRRDRQKSDAAGFRS